MSPSILRTCAKVGCAIFLLANAHANETDGFQELLALHSHPIQFEDGRLDGPGADLIWQSAVNSQFVALGEEHYNYIIPDITTAIFRELHEVAGYQYFMTEQDPVMMELMTKAPARGDRAMVNKLAQQYPMGVTFNSDEELRMLADIGKISEAPSNPVWGCDQAAGVTHILDELSAELTDERSIVAVQNLRKISAEKEAVRDFSKGMYIYDAPTSDFTELKDNIALEKGTRAEWLVDTIINGSKVFGFYENGKNGLLPGYYENNRFREEHLKDLCLAKYRSAEQITPLPRALMKFGSWHLFEGLSPTRMHTIGDFFSNVARFNGQEFLSIYFVSRPKDPQESMSNVGFLWPFIQDLGTDEFAVVDLRPFRRYPNRLLVEKAAGEEWQDEFKEDFVRLVYGYDLIFYVGETRSATFTVVPQP